MTSNTRAQAAPELITHSSSTCASTCLRRYFYRYELGLVPSEEKEATHRGSLFHAALEMRDHGLSDQEIADHVRARAMTLHLAEQILVMWAAHAWYWQNDQMEVVESEKGFELPLQDPTTGTVDARWKVAGKRDRIVRLADGRLALQEYKTTTKDTTPGGPYWARLRLDQQISRYMLAARAEGIDVATVIYDVTRWPGIRPYKATPIEERQYKKDGTLYKSQRLLDETPDEFAQRTMDAVTARPSDFFQRFEISRTEEDLAEFAQEQFDQAQILGLCRQRGLWYRNTAVCLEPFRCDYLSICADRSWAPIAAGQAQPPAGLKFGDKHPELDVRPSDES